MADTSQRNAFLIHLAVYVAVNAILFAVNASQAVPEGETREWWVLYPLAGWGIGLAAHAFGLWAERQARRGQLLADPDVRGVAVHLFVYLAVNAFLIAINITRTPDSLWSVWPLLGWGIGLAGHAWLVYRAVARKTMERYAAEQQILTEMQLERQAAAIAAAVAPQEKKKAPAGRRKQAAPKTAKKTAARKGMGRAAAKSSATAKTRKGPASTKGKTARKPVGRKSK